MRYLPLTADDRAEMLKVIGAKSVDDFYGDVPAGARPGGGGRHWGSVSGWMRGWVRRWAWKAKRNLTTLKVSKVTNTWLPKVTTI